MKEVFEEVNVSGSGKLNIAELRKYFKKVALKIKSTNFKTACTCSDECLTDIWFEFDKEETGFVSWHMIKPIMSRLVDHDSILTEEKNIANEKR
jgi:hypothetical protein